MPRCRSPFRWRAPCRSCVQRLREARLCREHFGGPDGKDHGHSLSCVICAQYEIDRLRQWKSEASEVLTEWEKVWQASGEPGQLGESKAQATGAEVDRLRAQVADAWDDGANAAREWIAAGAWLATMPTNPHRAALASGENRG